MKSVITPEKAAFIREHYLKLSGKKIAKTLGVSPYAKKLGYSNVAEAIGKIGKEQFNKLFEERN